MFFIALAADYDGTLASHGRVDDATCEALEEVRRSGRKLLLVTGRDLPDLQRVFDRLDLFDLVVAENGALLYDPAKKEEIALSDPPPAALVARLRDRGVSPLTVGRTIIATWQPNEAVVLECIRDRGRRRRRLAGHRYVLCRHGPNQACKNTGVRPVLAGTNLPLALAVWRVALPWRQGNRCQ